MIYIKPLVDQMLAMRLVAYDVTMLGDTPNCVYYRAKNNLKYYFYLRYYRITVEDISTCSSMVIYEEEGIFDYFLFTPLKIKKAFNQAKRDGYKLHFDREERRKEYFMRIGEKNV